MFKKQHLALAIAATLAAGTAQAALETSVTLKNETAYMLKDGIRTGEATNRNDTAGEGKGVYKFENTAKIYLNDELANGASWHGELNLVRDTKAINDYKGHESDTQRDFLRELYMDTTAGDWDLRVGKQQVVWGTADGIKLLDMINPTDWSEFNQNTMADARIPVWMINAERYLDNGGNIQFVLSQAKSNKIAGLGSNESRSYTYAQPIDNSTLVGVDAGHPFLMKGVDTITGKVNGFLNIVPALAAVSEKFSDNYDGAYSAGALNSSLNGAGANNLGGGFSNATITTVTGFVQTGGANAGYDALHGTANATNDNNQNLSDSTGGDSGGWDVVTPNTTFEYMADASFGTFDTFIGAQSEYIVDHPDDLDSNVAFRFKNTSDNGTNYSFNYSYAYDANPYVDLRWKNSSGETLQLVETNTNGGAGDVTTLDLKDSAGLYYGRYGEDGNAVANNRVAILEFTERLQRIHNIGTSFDTVLDTGSQPMVLKGEFLYQKNVRTPVIDRNKLGKGDLVGAMDAKKGDYFKYVLGAESTVATDLLVSGQFIQFRNLDYVDNQVDGSGAACDYSTTANCGIYTADATVMHLSNNMKKAEKNKEFYSLFFSKPFGASGEGRWNNIFMFEEGGGKWNRFDVEYGFDDQLIGTFEVNKYFGDNDTMFGQFENASNVQIGVKYLLQ
jgi:hypothetical protein